MEFYLVASKPGMQDAQKQQIVDLFVRTDGAKAINIPGETLEDILEEADRGNWAAVDLAEAREHVKGVMEMDAFNRGRAASE